ncbi:MAG TPA: ABC transporter permease, partial [Terriglobales bacterium]|nr:ABC transporter permease [Terriglobales bacterium]
MFLERWLRTLPLRLRSLFRREALEHELDDELRDHLDRKTRHYMAAGLSLEEARHQAIRDFDGLEVHKEECRDAQRVSWAHDLLQDVRYGLRLLRKSSGFTVIAALTLALGIGANTAIFSLVSGILLAPLPYPDPAALTLLNQATYPKGAVVAMREQIHSMDVAAYADGHEFNLTGTGEAVRLEGTLVSSEFFSILRAAPEIGRVFRAGEDHPGQDRFVILSHALWQRRFGGSSAILGRVIELDGVGREVIGVMPATFRFPSLQTEVWVPLENDPRSNAAYWAGDFMPVIGRLHSGASLAQANAQVHIFQSRVFALFPWPMPASWNANVSVISLQDGLVSNVRSRLFILLGAVALVLLIACANLANLTLSRAATREKEIAIRSSLGAPRWRITRQLLTESVLLALLGGSLGLLLAMKGLQVLKAILPADTPRLSDVQIDWRVLIFTGALAILTGFLLGIAPALQASRGALVDVLKSTGRGAAASLSQRLRSTLAVAEIALAVLLVIVAGLLVRSLWALSHVDPGFRSAHLLTARLTPNQNFCDDPARCLTFYRT